MSMYEVRPKALLKSTMFIKAPKHLARNPSFNVNTLENKYMNNNYKIKMALRSC